MQVGDKVSFIVHDSLFKDEFYCTGTISRNWTGKLWKIKTDPHGRLLKNAELLEHENGLTLLN